MPDWSVRSRGPGALVVVRTEPRTNDVHPTSQEEASASITTTTTTVAAATAAAAAGSHTITAGRKQSNVFDNRDLCRIISSYIPVKLSQIVGHHMFVTSILFKTYT